MYRSSCRANAGLVQFLRLSQSDIPAIEDYFCSGFGPNLGSNLTGSQYGLYDYQRQVMLDTIARIDETAPFG